MDCESLSHWIMDKKRLVENKRYKIEVELANKELDFLQKHSRKVTYLEGNHECWVEQYIDKHPEVEGMMEIPYVLNLQQRGIEYIKYNELYDCGHIAFTHGMYANKYHANKHMTTLGCNICYGHVHRVQNDMMNMKMQKPIMAYGLGCLCDHSPAYLKGRPANWINGFGICYFQENDNFNLYTVNIIDGSFIWEGKIYK